MIVIVGGSGLVGRRLAEKLREDGREVAIVTHRADRARLPGHRFGDLQAPETLLRAVAGADVVVQATQFPSYPIAKPRRGWTYMAYDGIGSERLVAAAAAAHVKRYVYVSGVGARPASGKPYFEAIFRAETAVERSGMDWACVRPAFIYGPRDHGMNTILRLARRSPVLPIVGAEARHQPVYIDDVAEALRRLIDPGAPGGTFEIGGPERMSMREMIGRAMKLAGVSSRIVDVPKSMARMGAALLERMPGELLCQSAIDFICEDFLADNSRIEAATGLRMTPLRDGLASYLGKRESREPSAPPRADRGAGAEHGAGATGGTAARVA